ncbi:MAG: LPS export ABC transporter periplasmic protein LptC [Betaproteobacteria bacterium TMED82]|nr:MAG: LPS export ABC transporter periplasmic protein LptC [Betaproteobacteria bacterium TMED82]|tara:strand:- start:603 stop:1172 length:570 start_codon:yes stop_codon:yes gene_type:complete
MNKVTQSASALLPLIIFLLLAVATGILSRLLLIEEAKPNYGNQPRVKLNQVMISQTDVNGFVIRKIKATSLLYHDDGIIFLENPFLKTFSVTDATINTWADYGEINRDEEVATLTGNVRILKLGPKNGDELKIRTDDLEIRFDKKIASTKGKVEISNKIFIIKGLGMIINQKTGEINILEKSSLIRGAV